MRQRTSVGRPPAGDLPHDLRIALDRAVSFWARGSVAFGGSAWQVVRVAEAARPFMQQLAKAGVTGTRTNGSRERAVARQLLNRGLAHPVIESAPRPQTQVDVVVPAFDRTFQLEACLRSLAGVSVLVVDDGSLDPEAVRRVATTSGARLLCHEVNRGPAAARNTGVEGTDSPLIAFVDSDCAPESGWLDQLIPHFDDPLVAAVAPRVRPTNGGRSLLARHEETRSALDMGDRPEQVRPGNRLGFVPSATIVVRRSALGDSGFDEALRLGEDVDLVWRLVDAGWQVRFEPGATVRHRPLIDPVTWVTRRFEYGTSASELHHRHPGRLAPLRMSAWNVASVVLLVCRRPRSAGLVSGAAGLLLRRRLRQAGGGGGALLAEFIVGKGLVAEAAAAGHTLRREWWPLGFVALATVRRSQLSRAAAACMLGPVAYEWLRQRPDVDPLRYAGLRLVEDAAYGSGVLASALRARSVALLRPEVRLPWAGAIKAHSER
ncbi:MAG: mycofactocin biosynthesis glycosyltransferase MftF [Marmoricola sp.]